MSSRITRVFIALGVSTALALTIPGVASAAPTDPNVVTATDISTALDRTDAQNGELVADAQPSANVDIPSDASRGVKLRTDTGQSLTIKLPGAGRSGQGVKTHKGAVAYSGNDGSANAVIPLDHGAQFLTTIKHRKAPVRYTYEVQTAGGVMVKVQPDGSALILAKDGSFAYTVARPWARDAKGRSVPTHFTGGTSLSQVVDHQAKGVTYPVTIDPRWSWWWGGVDVYLNRGDMGYFLNVGGAAIFGLVPASFVGVLGLAVIEQAIQNAWPQRRCVVLHLSWVRPSYTWTYAC